MKWITMLVLLASLTAAHGQADEEKTVRGLLAQQTEAWNRGDIEGFMQTYWKSDSLLFIGKSGVSRGWQKTLDNYKKGYPDTTAMGKLAFELVELKQLSPDYYYVVGKWMLTRSIGDLSGHFDLVLRKIMGRWYIIADHSS
ncbi:MAG TPA: DUF4440 domain-containing protein [Flavisolibacter sp.]|nr:DUF4440 domain-containing protein [Flavisolibacter sp.]